MLIQYHLTVQIFLLPYKTILFDWLNRILNPVSVCWPFQDDSTLCSGAEKGPAAAATEASPPPSITVTSDAQTYTESALRELYQQVNNMPESAKKKKLIRQVA